MGYAVWFGGWVFVGALLISILLIAAGKLFHIRVLSMLGGTGVLITFVTLLLYMILPGIMRGMYGAGCF